MKRTLCGYSPSRPVAVAKMLEVAQIKQGEILYDVGCGDGRLPIAAAKDYGIRSIGIEIDPLFAKAAAEQVKKEGLEELVTIVEGDVFFYSLKDADIVTLYLDSKGMKIIERKIFTELRPTARVVSNDFQFPNFLPNEIYGYVAESLIPSLSRHVFLYRMDDLRKKPRR